MELNTMKSRIFVIAALAAMLLLTACQQQKATGKIAVIDPSEVFQTCGVCKEGGEYLKARSEAMRTELTAMQAALQSDTSEDAPKKFQERYAALQEELMGEQTRIANLLNDAFSNVVEEYRVENGVAVVLSKEDVLSMDESVNITQAVIKAMDAKGVDLELPEIQAPEDAASGLADEGEAEETKAE